MEEKKYIEFDGERLKQRPKTVIELVYLDRIDKMLNWRCLVISLNNNF